MYVLVSMYVYIYICVYVYIYVCFYTWRYICICVHVYVSLSIYILGNKIVELLTMLYSKLFGVKAYVLKRSRLLYMGNMLLGTDGVSCFFLLY